MMDVSTKHSTFMDRVKAVAFGKKIFDRAFRPLTRRGNRPVARVKVRRSGLLQAAAAILVCFSRRPDEHGRMKVRQLEGGARAQDRGEAASIQAEEINAGNAFIADVCAHVQLTELAEKGQRRRESAPNSAHPERREGNVNAAIQQVQFEF